jgi:hypothetical protein
MFSPTEVEGVLMEEASQKADIRYGQQGILGAGG